MGGKKSRLLVGAGGLVLAAALVTTAIATTGGRNLKVDLSGYQEVPAVSADSAATFKIRVPADGDPVKWELSLLRGLEDVTQAHIHFGQAGVNGGISVWLCSRLASPPTPAGVEDCPTEPGTVTGTIEPSDVVGPAAQQLAAGELDELLAAIRAGVAYVNVHSTASPGGEVRAQLVEREDGN
jgi:hypothetical protein